MTRLAPAIFALTGLAASIANASAQVKLDLPVVCNMGQDCFVQQFVDLDPGPGVRDYACGRATYDGHKGTDIRVRTLADVERGVQVVASASGTVIGRRDGVADKIVKTAADRASTKNRECGNGVVIDHGGGWHTQYCHLRKGSLAVTDGESVVAGQTLGAIGYSGNVEFPHVHLSVRKDGNVVDPFRGIQGGSGCGLGLAPLWTKQALAVVDASKPDVMDTGFADAAVKLDALRQGSAQTSHPSAQSSALVAWGWAIKLQNHDSVTITLTGPEGTVVQNTVELSRDQADYVLFAGKKAHHIRWPKGEYFSKLTVTRAGKIVASRKRQITFR